jgi:hypothetical protein
VTSLPGAVGATTPSSRWEAQKRFVSDGTRARKKVCGRTKTEVRGKLRELKEKLAADQHTELEASPSDVTLTDCAET